VTEEWLVIRLDRALPGGFERHREGNRAKFDLETGRKLLLEKGTGWQLVHHKTFVAPKDHSDWLVAMDARHGPGYAAKLLDRTQER
jgi:hypothetical protein